MASEPTIRLWTSEERAVAEALHRMNLPECEPDADDYSDEAEHLIAAHDLLDSLRAHGWEVVPKGAAPGPLDRFSTALGRMGGPASERSTDARER